MTKLFIPIRSKHILWIFLGLLFSGNILQAQNITHTQDGDMYTFYVDPSLIQEKDLVYFRFSDGAHLKTVAQEDNNGQVYASASREFKGTGGLVDVIGYIAKKGGPLGYAGTGTVDPDACSTCENPTILLSDELIKLNASWRLFTDDSELDGFPDNTTSPSYTTPEIPWITLNAAIRSSVSTPIETLEIPIPGNFTIEHVIIEDEKGSGSFSPASSEFCQSVVINNNLVTVNLKEGFIGTANVYVLIAGYPSLTNSHLFTATVKEKGVNVDNHGIRLRGSQNPHDPNLLVNYEPYFCSLVYQPEPMDFRIDFQNEGAGPAEHVEVTFITDENVMDLTTFSLIESSHTVTSTSISGNEVTVQFSNIFLPGLAETPPYPQVIDDEETKGLIIFSMQMLSCVEVEGPNIWHGGQVLFDCPSCGPNGYQELTDLNEVFHSTDGCIPDPECVPESPVETRSSETGTQLGKELTLTSQPNPFDNLLNITVQNIEGTQPVYLQLFDTNGKEWHHSQKWTESQDFQWQIPGESLPSGLYFLRVRQGSTVRILKVSKL